jgi:putative transposase
MALFWPFSLYIKIGIVLGFVKGNISKELEEGDKVLKMAFEKHPNRFKGKVPKPMALPRAVWINKPSPNESDSVMH